MREGRIEEKEAILVDKHLWDPLDDLIEDLVRSSGRAWMGDPSGKGYFGGWPQWDPLTRHPSDIRRDS